MKARVLFVVNFLILTVFASILPVESADAFWKRFFNITPPKIEVFDGDERLQNRRSVIDFGEAQLNAEKPEKILTVKNIGQLPLIVYRTQTTGPFEAEYLKRKSRGSWLFSFRRRLVIIWGGQSRDLAVRMKTKQVQDSIGSLRLFSTDRSKRLFALRLQGKVVDDVTPMPEIQIAENGNLLTDDQDQINFGEVITGEPGPSRVFEVTNLGDADLEIPSLDIPAGFEVLDDLAEVIAPGETDLFELALLTDSVGEVQGELIIDNNDADENPFNINLGGTVLPEPLPEVAVALNGSDIATGQTINLGTVFLGGESPQIEVIVSNTGDGDLTTSNLEIPTDYELADGSNLETIIAPGDFDQVNFVLDTASLGPKNGILQFNNNDADEDPFIIRVKTDVLPLPAPEIQVLVDGTPTADASASIQFGDIVEGTASPVKTVTVSNIGNADLNTANLMIPPGFTLPNSSSLATTIAAGQSDDFEIAAITSSVGNLSGVVSFDNNDQDESPFDFEVLATITPAPEAEIDVLVGGNNLTNGATIDLGSVVAGDTAPSVTVTVRNSGNADLTTNNLNIGSGFQRKAGTNLAATIAPGNADTFSVELIANDVGQKSATLQFTNNDADENPFVLNLTGEVLPVPVPEVNVLVDGVATNSGATIDFGSALLNEPALSTQITVENTGDADLTTANLSLPAGYALAAGESLATTIAPDSSDSVVVVLETSSAGTFTGSLSFENNDADENPFTLNLSGEILQPQEIAVFIDGGELATGADTVDFGSEILNEAGPIKTFTILNFGDIALSLGAVTLPSGFAVTEGLGSELLPGGIETLSVQLDTAALGEKSGVLAIENGDADENPFEINLIGEVLPVPAPEISVALSSNGSAIIDGQTNAIDFGEVFVGDAAPTLTFSVTNEGDADLEVVYTNAEIADNPNVNLPAGYALTQEINQVLSPGSSASFSIALETLSEGNFGGEVSFATNDTDENPFNFPITGSVSIPPFAEIEVSLVGGGEIVDGVSSPIDFGSVDQDASAPSQSFLVENTGTANLTLGTPSVPTGFVISEALSSPIAPGSSDTVTIELTTASIGDFAGDVVITNNDGNENPFNFPITGSVLGETTCPGGDDNLGGTTNGLGLAFIGDPIDFETGLYNQPQEVCLTDLGVYDPETGELVEDNFDENLNGYVLNGFYSSTGQQTFTPQLPALAALDNDFRFIFDGSGSIPGDRSHLWASQVNMYYHVNEFRKNLLNTAFFESLNLDPEIEKNITTRQFRDGGFSNGSNPSLAPSLEVGEGRSLTSTNGATIDPFTNTVGFGARSTRLAGAESLPIISHSFDPSFVTGEYAGLMAFWILQTDRPFPVDAVCRQDFPNNIAGCLQDAVNRWIGYIYSGSPEIFKTFRYNLRKWADRNCGGPGEIPCERGLNIDNVMMYDRNDDSGDQIYPFENALPGGLNADDVPTGADRTSLYHAAIFYDIAVEAGLGDQKTNQLFWKTLSLINDVDTLTMEKFASLIQLAAAELWSNGQGGSLYDSVIDNVLTSRGIAVNGANRFYDNLPTRIGDSSTMALFNSDARFGSLHPDKQLGLTLSNWTYNDKRILRNSYTDSDSDFEYLTYNFYKHSKYGPCDKVMFSDGTFKGTDVNFEEIGEYNNDGSYIALFKDRQLGNTTLFAPGNSIRYVQHRNRCPDEEAGASTLDIHPFGFFVEQRIKNGFSFEVTRISEAEDTIEYQFDIYDPSLNLTGPRSGPATYTWKIKELAGREFTASGSKVTVSLKKNEPVNIEITRERSGIKDTLTKIERSNDLDRDKGRAFISDCFNEACN